MRQARLPTRKKKSTLYLSYHYSDVENLEIISYSILGISVRIYQLHLYSAYPLCRLKSILAFRGPVSVYPGKKSRVKQYCLLTVELGEQVVRRDLLMLHKAVSRRTQKSSSPLGGTIFVKFLRLPCRRPLTFFMVFCSQLQPFILSRNRALVK